MTCEHASPTVHARVVYCERRGLTVHIGVCQSCNKEPKRVYVPKVINSELLIRRGCCGGEITPAELQARLLGLVPRDEE